jgi:replicative DNA helicase
MVLPTTQSLHQAVVNNLKFLEENQLDTGTIKTLFKNIDDNYGGLALGEFIIFGGNKSIGKTPFLIHLALNVSLLNPVLYLSFDFTNTELTNRFISSASSISLSKITEQSLDFYEKIVLNEVRKNINNHKIFINGNPTFNLNKFKDYCLEQVKANNIKLIIVDCLNKMSIDYNNEIAELKNIAKENNVCIIGASQLEQNFDKETELSYLQLDSSIIALADKIIVMRRPEYFGIETNEIGESVRDITNLMVLKNKQGTLAAFNFRYNMNFTKFTEIQ